MAWHTLRRELSGRGETFKGKAIVLDEDIDISKGGVSVWLDFELVSFDSIMKRNI